MSHLYTHDLSLGYHEQLIVEGLNLSIPTGKISALVGANGSGKSTILRALARLLKPRGGAVYLDGKAIQRHTTKDVAQRLALLPQSPDAPEGLTVQQLVAYGRYPHQSGFGGLTQSDRDAVARALLLTGMAVFASRPLSHLSGGQRQRAWIAMALAQDTQTLLLDEPTTFLDMAHQLEVLHLLERLNKQDARTIVMIVHDLNHASRYAHHIVAIAEGAVVTEGPPRTVITPEMLARVFAIEADIIADPRTGVPLCIPQGLKPRALQET